MTYNVHRCIGVDGHLSPARIAEVIARYAPDVVALQELDVARPHTGRLDQPRTLAALLEMRFHFLACVEPGEGQYGNAILSRQPVELVRAGALPRRFPFAERRGAIWARIRVQQRRVQIINTHLGLSRRERLAQVGALLGPDWIGQAGCEAPLVLCGDLNAAPGSLVYRRLAARLRDAQRAQGWMWPAGTWPTIFPTVRIDHVFTSEDIGIEEVIVPRTELTRQASDHFPVVVTAVLR
jgi:endonuclease/exonuclease/phosphatase family metal-dependent hydrolase